MNNNKNDLKKKKISMKTIVIIIDIIVIIGIIISIVLTNNRQKDDNVSYIQRFKCFVYNIPGKLNYKVDANDTLIIKNQNWLASMDIIGDRQDYILSHKEILGKALEYEYGNINIKEETIDNVSVLIYEYKKENETGMICYFKSLTEPYIYEVTLQNVDGSYNTTALSTIISILMTGNYDPPEVEDYDIMFIRDDADNIDETSENDNVDNNE